MVEFSGGTLAYNGATNLLSAGVSTGTLVLDPGQINIVAGAGTNTTDTFYADSYATALGTANVTIATSGATNASGATQDIVIGAGTNIAWSASGSGNTALTLQAGNNITGLNAVSIQNSGAGTAKNQGGIAFLASNDIIVGSASGRTRAVTIGSQYGLTKLVAGDPGVTGKPPAAGNVKVTGGDVAGSSSQVGYSGGAGTAGGLAAGDIRVYAGTDVIVTGGAYVNTLFKGTAGQAAFAQIGQGGAAATAASLAGILGSDVTVLAKTGSVKLDANGAETNYAQIGHGFSSVQSGTGSAPSLTVGNISGNITVGGGTSVLLSDAITQGRILISATDTGAIGNQIRAWLGNRQTIGSDRPSWRPTIVVQGGKGGDDIRATAPGYVGNGGDVSITQAGMPGLYDSFANQTGTNDFRLLTYGTPATLPSNEIVSSNSDAADGHTSAEVGHSILTASAKAGDGGAFGTLAGGPRGLYGVREGNGGSVNFVQGTLTNGSGTNQSDAIVATIKLDAANGTLIHSNTLNAGNIADTTIGNEMIAGDQKYVGYFNGDKVTGNTHNGLIPAAKTTDSLPPRAATSAM